MFTNVRRYSDLDAENPGSGLRLWISRNGISEEYHPHYVATKGPAMHITPNGFVTYQQGFDYERKAS